MGNIIKVARNFISSLPKELREFGFIVQRRRPCEMGKSEKFVRTLLWPLVKTTEALMSVYISLIIVPLLLILWLVNEIVRRLFITPLLWFQFGDEYQLVPAGEDNIWSFKKQGNSRNILMLTVFRGQIDVKEYQQNFKQRVLNYVDREGKKPYGKLKQIFTQKFGYCCWKKDGEFDIRNHIKILSPSSKNATVVTNTKEFVTESDLTGILSELTRDMSTEHPQWEEIIIPKFVYDRDLMVNGGLSGEGDTMKQLKRGAKIRSAKVFRFHHAFMEGLSAIVMLKTCMVDGPFDCSMDPLAPLKIGMWDRFLGTMTLLFFGATKMVGNIFSEMNADSRFLTPKFNQKITHAWSEPIRMDVVEKIQRKVNCSAAEILTCALGGALRAVSENFCKKPQWLLFPDTLEESVLVGLAKFVIPYPSEGPQNRFGVIGLDVNTTSVDGSSRLDRLQVTREGFQRYVRGSPVLLLNNWLMKFVGRFPQFVIQKLLKDAGAPVVFSNIPRIRNKVTLMGGLEIEEFAGWMPMLTSTGIGVATAKYEDTMRLCGVTETGCLCTEELDYLLKAMRNEVIMMAEECS